MRYLSTFTGIGGFELGINKAYEELTDEENWVCEKCGCTQSNACEGGCGWKEPNLCDKHELVEDSTTTLSRGDSTEFEGRRRFWEYAPHCIGYSEINKYADQIYQKHFPNHKNYGDITKINEKELPDFDLFVGGFPCQAFSIAGKRGGFDDTRGTLFFDCARILKEKQPRNFILENVKGLLSHDNGRTFATIINTLTELGYCVEWQVLNAKNFGVPQNRERVFIVGHLGGIPQRKVFPIGSEPTEDTRRVGEEVSYTLDANYAKGTNTLKKSRRQVIRQPLRFLDRNQKNMKGDYSFTIDASQTSGVRVDSRIRRLTPLECERLMGYPDNWTEGLSDTQRYKTLGNGIVSKVVEEVVRRLF